MPKINPDTLASILTVDGLSLVPISSEQRLRAAMEVRRAMRHASTDDDGSKALKRRFESVQQILSQKAREELADVPFLWVETGLPHAAAIELYGSDAIVVCRGLFDLVHFQTALISVCSLLLGFKSQIPSDPEEVRTPSDLMNLAGHVVLADAYSNIRAPATIADMLGEKAYRDVELGVSTSMVLLILHELGHVALGHTRRTKTARHVATKVVPAKIKLGERRRLEMEADAYAIDSIAIDWQPRILSSLINLYSVFQFFEIFGVKSSDEYPPAAKRIAAMVDRLRLQTPERQFAKNWLDGYRNREAMINSETSTPTKMISQFDKTMDIHEAYRAIEKIRSDLRGAGFVLERSD